MSTATAPERSHAPYAEPDEYIDYQLRKTQTGIKRIDMLTAAIVAITVLIGYVLLFVLSDHWLFEGGVGGTARMLMFLPVIGFVGWLIGAKVIWPAMKNVSGLYAARTLEASSTEFRSGLLNLVDLKQAGREVSPLIMATMEKRAAVTLAKFNVDDAIDKRPLLRTLYVLFGIVVAFCLYSVLSPKKLGPSVLRAIVPFTNVTPATQTEILEVKPGDAKLRAGGILPVSVQLRGEVPANVTLLFTTTDRRFVDEPVQLGATTDPNLFEGTLGNDEHGLLQSFSYHVVAGDARSPEYHVEIITPPSATVTEVRYDYPEYTELDPRTQMGGAIDVWERTAITISAVTNVPVKRAEFELADTEDFSAAYPGSSVKIADGKTLTITWRADPRQADDKFPKFYRIKVWDAEDTVDPKPAVYPINVRVDQPPQVVLIDPTTNLELPANGTVPLVVAARDQDFKLRTVSLKIARDENDVTDEELFNGLVQEVGPLKHDFALEPLRLKAGDKIRIWVEAQDNRLPTHNLAKTSPIEITIKDKVSKEEAKKQLEEEKKEQQKRLDEAAKNNDQPNDPNGQPQPGEEGKGNNDPVLTVQLFDEELNQPMSVSEYARAMGLPEPLFRGYVVSDFGVDGRWRISTDGSLDGTRRPIVPPKGQRLTIRQELRQQLTAEALDAGILHALPPYGDCRVEEGPANPGRVLQGRVNSALYREKPLAAGFETKYVAMAIKPDRNDNLSFPLATLETELAARDRDFYCRMPAGMNDLRKFARQAVVNRDGSVPEPVEIAKRLRTRLRKPEFKYKKPEPGLPRWDTVEPFLLVEHEGDCKQFNSALALMLREFKIPSRMILGFKGGVIEDGEFVVRGTTGHAWVEAYLNGHWLILDATPADGVNRDDQSPRDPDNSREREQPEGNQPKDDQPQQDGKNSKENEDGAGKNQKGTQDGKNQTENGGKSGQRSLKNDGSQDQEILEKIIAQNEKKHDRLPKKSEQQNSSPSAQREPQENSTGEPPEKPMPNGSSKPNAQDDPNENDGSKPSTPNRGQQSKPDKNDNADSKSPKDENNSQPSEKPNAEKGRGSEESNDPKKADGSKEPKGNSPKDGGEPKPRDKNSAKPDGTGKEPNAKDGDDKNADGSKKPMPKGGPGEKKEPSASDDKGDEKPGTQKPAPNDKAGNDQKPSNDGAKSDGQKPKGQGKPETDDKQRSPDGAKSDKPSNENKSPNSKDDKADNDQPDSKRPSDPSGKGSEDKNAKSPDKPAGSDKSEDGKPGDKGSEKGDSSKKPRRGNQGEKSKPSSNEQGDDGQPTDKSGDDKSGQPKEGDRKNSGQSKKDGAQKDGQGGQKPDGQAGQQKPSGKAEDGQASDSESAPKGQSKPGSQGSKSAKPGTTSGSGPSQPGDSRGSSSSSGSGSSSETPDEANEEFTKEAANLVLKRLQKDVERGEVDQELLDELGWTEEQMKKFLERMQQNLEDKPDDDSPQSKARRRQFEEMLRNLNLTEKTQRRDDTNKDKQTGEGIGPVRRPPPPEYREAYESFTKGLSKKKAAETPKK